MSTWNTPDVPRSLSQPVSAGGNSSGPPCDMQSAAHAALATGWGRSRPRGSCGPLEACGAACNRIRRAFNVLYSSACDRVCNGPSALPYYIQRLHTYYRIRSVRNNITVARAGVVARGGRGVCRYNSAKNTMHLSLCGTRFRSSVHSSGM